MIWILRLARLNRREWENHNRTVRQIVDPPLLANADVIELEGGPVRRGTKFAQAVVFLEDSPWEVVRGEQRPATRRGRSVRAPDVDVRRDWRGSRLAVLMGESASALSSHYVFPDAEIRPPLGGSVETIERG